MHSIKICLSILLFLGLADATEVDNHGNVDIHRDANGRLTPDSLENVKYLVRKAQREGYVALWLTADLPYNPNIDELSMREIRQQDRNVWRLFETILQPLVNDGIVWSVPERPNTEGPGCLVHANARGVTKLVRDTRLRHIHLNE